MPSGEVNPVASTDGGYSQMLSHVPGVVGFCPTSVWHPIITERSVGALVPTDAMGSTSCVVPKSNGLHPGGRARAGSS